MHPMLMETTQQMDNCVLLTDCNMPDDKITRWIVLITSKSSHGKSLFESNKHKLRVIQKSYVSLHVSFFIESDLSDVYQVQHKKALFEEIPWWPS